MKHVRGKGNEGVSEKIFVACAKKNLFSMCMREREGGGMEERGRRSNKRERDRGF